MGQLQGWDSGIGVPASALPPTRCATHCKSQTLSVLQSLPLPMKVGPGEAEGLHRCPLGDPTGSPGLDRELSWAGQGGPAGSSEATLSSAACELGFYKSAAGDQLCARCPPHSHSAAPAAQACRCDLSYYRAALDPPSAACTREY